MYRVPRRRLSFHTSECPAAWCRVHPAPPHAPARLKPRIAISTMSHSLADARREARAGGEGRHSLSRDLLAFAHIFTEAGFRQKENECREKEPVEALLVLFNHFRIPFGARKTRESLADDSFQAQIPWRGTDVRTVRCPWLTVGAHPLAGAS